MVIALHEYKAFWYNIANAHFSNEVTFAAIFVLNIQYFCLHLPEALFNSTKTGF